MGENKVKDQIRLLSQKFKLALFSNPCGVGWCGKFIGFDGQTALILGGHRVEFGLFEGSPDQVGWLKLRVTQEMVGKDIAVFVGIEAKDERGRATIEQVAFVERIIVDGGIAGIVKSGDEAERVIISWMERMGANMADIQQTLVRQQRSKRK